jgi:hypothetical protein
MNESYQLFFSSKAIVDLKEARLWYNLQQKGLGKKMITDVKNVIASIKRNTYFTSVKFANIRTATCKTFPYAIHFEIDEDKKIIRIVSIFHFSRRPYWLDE